MIVKVARRMSSGERGVETAAFKNKLYHKLWTLEEAVIWGRLPVSVLYPLILQYSLWPLSSTLKGSHLLNAASSGWSLLASTQGNSFFISGSMYFMTWGYQLHCFECLRRENLFYTIRGHYLQGGGKRVTRLFFWFFNRFFFKTKLSSPWSMEIVRIFSP